MLKEFKSKAEIPTASMADIAFLLIIFFLVTTTMNMDKGLGLTLPAAGEGKEVPRKNIAHVWINAIGEIALDGVVLTGRFQELRGEVERRLRENDKLIVSVKADEQTEYRYFVGVIDELKLAGATRISIANPEK